MTIKSVVVTAALVVFMVSVLVVQQAFGLAGQLNSPLRYGCLFLIGRFFASAKTQRGPFLPGVEPPAELS